jgi:hypothetical protein
MKDKLSELVLDSSKKNNLKLAELNAKLLNASSIPHGTYSPIDTRLQQAGKTETYIRQFRIIPLIIWREVIHENFDTIAETKKNDAQGSDSECTGVD